VASLLPAGQATPGHHFRVIEDASGQTVGLIWFAAEEQGGQKIAYVYDIRIFPEARRKGHARRAFRALEGLVQELGLAGIGLHVFGHNAAAHALYVELGYRPTGINLFKALGPPLPN
jgi:ribosomal protein S18 acetylase RimI-like enzyme